MVLFDESQNCVALTAIIKNIHLSLSSSRIKHIGPMTLILLVFALIYAQLRFYRVHCPGRFNRKLRMLCLAVILYIMPSSLSTMSLYKNFSCKVWLLN